jgi:hypothetical protein
MDIAIKRGVLTDQPSPTKKKVKTGHIDSQSGSDSSRQNGDGHCTLVTFPDGLLDLQASGRDPTALESSLPPTEPCQPSMSETRWSKGRSSIYVDAFNLALNTVLEDEAHLFNNQESAIFDKWKSLGYEAQYL